MKKIFFIALTILMLSCHSLVAQFDTQLSNYWSTINAFNPAYAGQSGNLEATLISRLQWMGITRAPRSTILTAEMPLQFMGRTHGVGASMYNDRQGFFSTTVISGQYAWKKKLFKGDFSVGLQLGYIQQSFDAGDDLILGDSDDHSSTDEGIPTGAVSGSSVDAALGLFYSKPKWFAGISVTHLLAPELSLGGGEGSESNYYMEIPRTYYFIAGYNIQLNNPLIELRPTILLKTLEMSSVHLEPDSLVEVIEEDVLKAMMRNTQLDVSVRMVYNKKFWGGLSWRNGDAMVLMLGGKFKMIEAGYAYDFPISKIIKESTGSHEIFIKYVLDLNLKKGIKNRHKSVRIL